MRLQTKAESPALHLIRHVARYEGHQQGRSNDREDHAITGAIYFAIRFGLQFDIDDFKIIEDYSYIRFCNCQEGWYTAACGEERGRNNKSAALAIEKWLGRKPFLFRDPTHKTATRIHIGRQIIWHGKRARVTSFNDAKQTFSAVTYKTARLKRHGYQGPEKIDRRFTITHEDIKHYHAALKEAAKAQKADEVSGM